MPEYAENAVTQLSISSTLHNNATHSNSLQDKILDFNF
jgi:hypothetical protein